MSDLEDSFLAEIARQPHDWLPRLIFADWLEEQGDPRGELIRLSHRLTRLDCVDRQQQEARLQELAAAGVTWPSPSLTNSLNLKLVLIPAGEFRMGSPESEPDRQSEREDQVMVTLTHGYWLGQHAVTQAEWEALMGTTPWKGQRYARDGSHCPATWMSWDDAREFCAKVTAQGHQEGWLPTDWQFDLPTEAQWEYACRAGTTTRFACGDDESRLGEYAWFDKTAWDQDEKYAHPVEQKKPNAWGLYDMHGNVDEWCRGVAQLPGETGTDGQNRGSRGGHWYSYGRNCRCARRFTAVWGYFGSEVGFRLALVQSGSH